jgi:hypothetical protein
LKKNQLKKTLSELQAGDLVCVEWCDASVGKSSGSGVCIDVPVKSWGVYVGMFGEKTKHIVGLYDLDYTAIPLGWTVGVSILVKEYVPRDVAAKLVNSFLLGGHRAFSRSRTFQKRLSTHGRPH